MRRAVRHMCTVSEATDTAAMMASSPSQSEWFEARWNREGGADADEERERDAPVHRRDQLAPSALAQIAQG